MKACPTAGRLLGPAEPDGRKPKFHSGSRRSGPGLLRPLQNSPLAELPFAETMPSFLLSRSASSGRCHRPPAFALPLGLLTCFTAHASELVGSWSLEDETGPVILTFLANGEFVLIQDGDATVDPSGQDGFERGLYDWDPETGRFVHTASLLPNGKVLVVGGYWDDIVAKVHVYDPESGPTGTWSEGPPLEGGRVYHAAAVRPDGTVFISGGYHLESGFEMKVATNL